MSSLWGASIKGEQQETGGKVDEDGCDSGMVSEMEDEGVGAGSGSVGMAAESCSGKDCRQVTGEGTLLPKETAFRSSLISAMNDLKSDVKRMQSDIQALRGSHARSTSVMPEYCFLFVRLMVCWEEGLGMSLLESMLGCHVEYYKLIKDYPAPSFKVKVAKVDVVGAITMGRNNGCFVDVWVGAPASMVASKGGGGGRVQVEGRGERGTPGSGIKIISWNCRGVSSSIPYIEALLAGGTDILFLCETWLWPYDLFRLSEIDAEFESWGRADDRLSESAEGRRGCVGIVEKGSSRSSNWWDRVR